MFTKTGRIKQNDYKPRTSGFRTDVSQKVKDEINEGYKRKNYSMFVTKQEINQYNDSGSYSRYFSLDAWYNNISKPIYYNIYHNISKTFPFIITPKASKSERNKGCEDLEPEIKGNQCQNMTNMLTGSGNIRATKFNNHHPTVKPLKLFSYLITMGSREGDLVLDPFIGSGTTYLASVNLHRECIGIELNPEYLQIAKARVKPLLQQTKLEG